MKTRNSKALGSFATILLILSHPCSQAVPVLSGILQDGREPGQNGVTAGSPIFNTLGNESSFANIYLTQPNGGYNAPLLNSGNGNAASVSHALAPGTHEFYFFTMGFWNNDPGVYGLNLFFNGDNTNPGISAYSPRAVLSANAAAAGLSALALNGNSFGVTPTPADLSFAIDGFVVTLTEYGFGPPGSFGVPTIDRVGNLNSVPDGHTDSVGRFTLHVATVATPMPDSTSSVALMALAMGFLVIARTLVPGHRGRKSAGNRNTKSPRVLVVSSMLLLGALSVRAADIVWSVGITNLNPAGTLLALQKAATSTDGSSLWGLAPAPDKAGVAQVVWLASDGTLIREIAFPHPGGDLFPYRVTTNLAVAIQRSWGTREETVIELRRTGAGTSASFTPLRGSMLFPPPDDNYVQGFFTAERVDSDSVVRIHKYEYGVALAATKAADGVILNWQPIPKPPFHLQASSDLVGWENLEDLTNGVRIEALNERQFFRLKIK